MPPKKNPDQKKKKVYHGAVLAWFVTLNPNTKLGLLAMDPPAFDSSCVHYQAQVQHCGEQSGLFHWHMIIQYKSPRNLSQVKFQLGCQWADCRHLKSLPAAKEYLADGHTTVQEMEEFGEWHSGGHRTDFEDLQNMVSTGADKKQIYSTRPGLLRYVGAVNEAISVFGPKPPSMRDMTVWYLYGTTGVGKTHRAVTAFDRDLRYMIKGKFVEGKSFDMYKGEDVLILDEWDPMEWPLTSMNDFLDKYECPLTCRYQNKYAMWTRVIICSNIHWDQCYPAVRGAQKDSFLRRLTHKIEIIDQENPVVKFYKET